MSSYTNNENTSRPEGESWQESQKRILETQKQLRISGKELYTFLDPLAKEWEESQSSFNLPQALIQGSQYFLIRQMVFETGNLIEILRKDDPGSPTLETARDDLADTLEKLSENGVISGKDLVRSLHTLYEQIAAVPASSQAAKAQLSEYLSYINRVIRVLAISGSYTPVQIFYAMTSGIEAFAWVTDARDAAIPEEDVIFACRPRAVPFTQEAILSHYLYRLFCHEFRLEPLELGIP